MESTKTLSVRDELYTHYMVHRNLTTNLSELDGTDWILTSVSYWISPSDFIGNRWSEYVGKYGYQLRSDQIHPIGMHRIKTDPIRFTQSECIGLRQIRSDSPNRNASD
jgi:hypothetical protein